MTDQSDRNHRRVLAIAQNVDEALILPGVVLPEICYLIASRLGHGAMRRFVANLTAVQIESTTSEDLARIHEILEQYADSQLDFTDASIVTIAERCLVNRVYTLDRRDFTMIRPKHCAYFEILP